MDLARNPLLPYFLWNPGAQLIVIISFGKFGGIAHLIDLLHVTHLLGSLLNHIYLR